MIDFVDVGPDLLGECPLWDGATRRLYWIDIDGRAVRALRPAERTVSSRRLPGRPGSIALTPDDGVLLVSSEHEVGLLEWDSGEYSSWVELEEPASGNRMNDGRCDPHGRFWVGSMFERSAAGRFTGMLHRLEPSGAAATIDRRVGIANGLAFSPDGRHMYFADTLRRVVWAYDYSEGGERSNRRVFSDFAGLPGAPDGACVDETGCYWIACVGGWAVARLTAKGDVDRIVELPVEKPTMPAFGGSDLGRLFVTSIGPGASSTLGDAAPQPNAGRLLTLDVGVSGLEEHRFGGRPLERSNHRG